MAKIQLKSEYDHWYAHTQLWQWLADNPGKAKTHWPGFKEDAYGCGISGDCFACNYALMYKGDGCKNACEICPIKEWRIPGGCLSAETLFYQWERTACTDEKLRTVALQIKELWEEPTLKIAFYRIDSFNRPVFKTLEGPAAFYGFTDVLFNYHDTEEIVKHNIADQEILYFGTHFDCEPMGTKPIRKLEII